MEIKGLSSRERNILDNFAQDSLLQKWEWGNFKEKYGWKAKRFGVEADNKFVYAFQVLVKKLPLGFSFFYYPLGSLPNEKILKEILNKLKELAKEEKAIFLQLDIVQEKNNLREKELFEQSFVKSFEEIQPKNTLLLALTQSEEEILKQMKPKGRYNIKVAQKHGVKVKEIKSLEDFKDYQKLHEETVKRDKISARSFEYLKDLFSTLRENDLGTAFIAYYKNEPISGIIASLAGERATYMYGASTDNYRHVMAAYLLQWEAIKYAKVRGAKVYDFFGIAPTDDPNHQWAGITRFKKQFGGQEIESLGSYDLVFKPLWYNLFKVVMKLRKIR